MAIRIGMRVVIALADPEQWVRDSVPLLNGRTGFVVERCARYITGEGRVDVPGGSDPEVFAGYLVQFDEPCPPWHASGRPHAAFWFEAADFKKETGR